MKHAVVIPLYNKAAYVEQAILSLAKQNHKPAELIIVDDASTDKSLEIVRDVLEKEKDAFLNTRIEIVELKKNRGPGHARNRGFERTQAELVSFLDADDLYSPGFFQQVQHVMADQAIDFLVLGVRYFPSGEADPELETLHPWMSRLEPDLYLLNDPLEVVTQPAFVMGVGSNVVARRKWLEKERFEENVHLNEGIDYWYRVLKALLEKKESRIALLMGGYLQVREVLGSLSRKKYQTWKEIDFPPVLKRYRNSSDRYDKRLMHVIRSRWLKYSVKSLASNGQKILFVLNYRDLYFRQAIYSLLH